MEIYWLGGDNEAVPRKKVSPMAIMCVRRARLTLRRHQRAR